MNLIAKRLLVSALALLWAVTPALSPTGVWGGMLAGSQEERKDKDNDKDNGEKDRGDRDEVKDKDQIHIAITSPKNGAVLPQATTDVVVAFSFKKDEKEGEDRITSIDLLANGKDVATFDLPANVHSGSHTFPGVNLAAFANTGKPITLVAGAFLGKHRKHFLDSAPVLVTVQTVTDTTSPQISGLIPSSSSFTNNPRPLLSAQVTDTGGSGVDPASIVLRLDGSAVAATVTLANLNAASVTFTPGANLSEGQHTFTVDAKDKAGNAATTASSSFLVDLAPPVGSISAPAAGSISNNSTPTITGAISDAAGSGIDPASIVLRLNGAAVGATITFSGPNAASLSFTPATPLAQGSYSVTLDAKDKAGNAAPMAISSFILDLTPPSIAVSSPPAGFGNNPKPPLSAVVTDTGGSGVDPASIIVLLDGAPVVAGVSVVNPNTVSLSITPGALLTEGSHAYTINARDRAGNAAATATAPFSIDLMPPAITILAPVSGSSGDNPKPALSASITDTGGSGIDASSVTVSLDGATVAAAVTLSTPNAASVAFTPVTNLLLGSHTFTINAKDLAKNAAAFVSSTFTVTNTQLILSNPSIPNGGFVDTSKPTFTATLTNPEGTGINSGSIVVRVDGTVVPATVTVVGANTVTISFTQGTALAQGPHSITITGQTGGGNPFSTVTDSFGVDLTPPTIQNVVPADAALLNSSTPTLSATVTDIGGSGVDPNSIGLVLNGILVPATVTINDPNTATLQFLPSVSLMDGLQSFLIQANDRAGNAAASVSVSFSIDTTPPAITIIAPADGSFAASPPVALNASIVDALSGIAPSSVQVQLNSADVTNQISVTQGSGTTFGAPATISLSGTLSLQPGANTLRITASDIAGNSALATSTVTFSTAPSGPLIALSDPVPNSVLSDTNVQLFFSVFDPVGFLTTGVSATLNGQPVSLDQGSASGSLTAMDFTAVLQAQTGVNTLTITATDSLGASSTNTYQFTVVPAPGVNPQITILSGDGQSGTTGFLAEPLIIQVTDGNTGNSLPGYHILFNRDSGDGRLSLLEGTDLRGMGRFGHLTTDGGGQAQMGFIYGDGTTVVSASIAGIDDLKVQFTLQGHMPTLTVDVPISLCNPNPSTTDYEGSALRARFRAQLLDHDGKPLEGQVISAKSLTDGIGYFLPSEGVTDANGIALFAWVNNHLAPGGTFTHRWSAEFFHRSDGTVPKVESSFTVTTGSREPEVNYDNLDESGQGQLAEPNQVLPLPLLAKTGVGHFVTFQVIEGDGQITGVAEGSLDYTFASTCAQNPVWLVFAPNGRASVTYRKGSTRQPEVVMIGQGSDAFAIGSPEKLLVEESSPGSGNFQLLDQARVGARHDFSDGSLKAIPENVFYIEVRNPLNGPSTVSQKITSLGASGNAASQNDLMLANVSTTLSLQKVEDYQGRFSRYRSGKMAAVQAIAQFNETVTPTAALKTGETALQLVEERGFSLEDSPQDKKKKAALVLPEVALTCVGGIEPNKNMATETPTITETFQLAGNPAPADITTAIKNSSDDTVKGAMAFDTANADGTLPFKITGADAYRKNPTGDGPVPEGGWVDVDVLLKGKVIGTSRIIVVPQLWLRMLNGEFGSGRAGDEVRFQELAGRSAVLRNRLKHPTLYPGKTMKLQVTVEQFKGAFNPIGTAASTRAGLLAVKAVGTIPFDGGSVKGKVRWPLIYDLSVSIGGRFFADILTDTYQDSLAFVSARGYNLKVDMDQVSILIRSTQNANNSSTTSFDDLAKDAVIPPGENPPRWYAYDNIFSKAVGLPQVLLMPKMAVERLALVRLRPAGDNRTVVNLGDQIFEDNLAQKLTPAAQALYEFVSR